MPSLRCEAAPAARRRRLRPHRRAPPRRRRPCSFPADGTAGPGGSAFACGRGGAAQARSAWKYGSAPQCRDFIDLEATECTRCGAKQRPRPAPPPPVTPVATLEPVGACRPRAGRSAGLGDFAFAAGEEAPPKPKRVEVRLCSQCREFIDLEATECASLRREAAPPAGAATDRDADRRAGDRRRLSSSRRSMRRPRRLRLRLWEWRRHPSPSAWKYGSARSAASSSISRRSTAPVAARSSARGLRRRRRPQRRAPWPSLRLRP